MRFTSLGSRRTLILTLFVLGLLIAEFLVLEGTVGINLPSERYSAVSRLEIKVKGLEDHFITHNCRFTTVDLLTAHGTHRETLVLRESFFADREYGREGPPNATVTVEGIRGRNVRWTFQGSGQRGDAVTDNLYMVTKFGCCGAPNVYTYFSLADGRKVRTAQGAELSTHELVALDGAVIPE